MQKRQKDTEGQPHSMTLARPPGGLENGEAFGVRLSFLCLFWRFRLRSFCLSRQMRLVALKKAAEGTAALHDAAATTGGLLVSYCHQHNALSRAQRVVKWFVDVIHWVLRRNIPQRRAGLDETPEMIRLEFLRLRRVFVRISRASSLWVTEAFQRKRIFGFLHGKILV